MKRLSFIFSLLMLSAETVHAAYGVDDVANDSGEKTETYGTELEINEFVLLDAMPNIELYYYPYSATDADAGNSEDVPGGAGSVYVGGGEIRWHSNIESTISIDDFTLTHIDAGVTARNTMEPASTFVSLDTSLATGSTSVAALDFDETYGATVAGMSADMTASYDLTEDTSSRSYDTDEGHTDFATKFYLRMKLAESGDVQAAGTYQATATVRAAPLVSSGSGGGSCSWWFFVWTC